MCYKEGDVYGYLKTNKEFEDEIIEENMMDFYKRRRKEGAGGKDMYGRVKDFDVDGYKYSKAESTLTTPVFLRKQS